MGDTIGDQRPQLPLATIESLRTVGVPGELRLAGWLGPTLFSSEVSDGRLAEEKDGYLLGSVRETSGAPQVHARFWLQRGTGTVLWESPRGPTFANSDVGSFTWLLNYFAAEWGAGDLGDESLQRLITGLRREIERLDPRALKDDDGFWPAWIAQLNEQLEW
jgi:hypothetical protein